METKPPTLFLMVGLPCAGKTTRAKELEKTHHALRLTPDEWMQKIVGNGYDEPKRAAIENIMIEIAERCLTLSISVILDFGFWTKAERNALKAMAQKIHAKVEIHFLNPSQDELIKRMESRQSAPSENTFGFSKQQLEQWSQLFEVPKDDEL